MNIEKPILCMITYNRFYESKNTINSLLNTNSVKYVDFQIIDNGSTDEELIQYLKKIQSKKIKIHFLDQNIGCPKALNIILKTRKNKQHFIKIDNDVKVYSTNWLNWWMQMIELIPEIVLIGGYYPHAFSYNRLVSWHIFNDNSKKFEWAEVYPAMGRFMFHRGSFLDEVGFFDVLSDDHLYGFEDLLICAKAKKMKKKIAIHPNVKIKHLQNEDNYILRDSEDKNQQINHIKKFYIKRLEEIESGKIYTPAIL